MLIDLPRLIAEPLAVFPSTRDDGSLIVVTVAKDRVGDPVIVPVLAETSGNTVVLSVYGKENGEAWVQAQIRRTQKEGGKLYLGEGFAASNSEAPEAKSDLSPALIAADEATKPIRKVLSIKSAVKRQNRRSSLTDRAGLPGCMPAGPNPDPAVTHRPRPTILLPRNPNPATGR